MQTSNVYYTEKPASYEIRRCGRKAVVNFPTDVVETQTDDGQTMWIARTVYFMETMYTPNLAARIEADYDAWLEQASEPVVGETTIADVVESINALTDIILGGE